MVFKQTHVSSDGRERSCAAYPGRCPLVLRQGGAGAGGAVSHYYYLDGERLTGEQCEQIVLLYENYGHLTYMSEENYSKNLDRFIRTQLTINETGEYVLVDTLEQKTLIAAHPLTARHIKTGLYHQYLRQQNPPQPGNPFGRSVGLEGSPDQLPEHIKQLYLCQKPFQVLRDRHRLRWEQIDEHVENGVPVDLAAQLVYPQGVSEEEGVLHFQNFYSKHLTETTATIINEFGVTPLRTFHYSEITTLERYLRNNPYLHTHPEVQRLVEVITQPEQLQNGQAQYLTNSLIQNSSLLDAGDRGILDRLVDTQVSEILMSLYVHHPQLLTQPEHQRTLHQFLQKTNPLNATEVSRMTLTDQSSALLQLTSKPEIFTLPPQTIQLLLQYPVARPGFVKNPHIHQYPQILRYLKKVDPDWHTLYYVQNPNIHHSPKLVHQILQDPKEEDRLSSLLVKPELFHPDLINHPTYGSKIVQLIHQQIKHNPNNSVHSLASNPKIGDPEQQETFQLLLRTDSEATIWMMSNNPSLPNPLSALVKDHIHQKIKQNNTDFIDGLSQNPALINHPELTETVYQHLKKTGNMRILWNFAHNPVIYHYPNIFRELLNHSNPEVRFFAYGQ